MSAIKVNCENFEISNNNKICIIAGPCQLESEQHAMDISGKIKEITSKLGVNFIYKTSFDKANRTSLKGKKIIRGSEKNLGGTMRLGLYDAVLKNNSLISKIYSEKKIKERHRHRYEVNIAFKDKFENKGMIFSGLSPDNKLPEIIELKNHPWFVGVQFHPEFKSRPLSPHPLFSSFIKAAKNHK